MDREQIFDVVVGIIRRIFLRDDLHVTLKTAASDVPGWDSFKMIEIIMEVEERFAITMETRDMDQILCVGDMVVRIDDKVSARGL